MAQLTSQYLNYALQSLVVSTLEKDGAVCNFFAKNYDEKETYNGGTGFRKAFKTYNDKIIDYHTLLKVLTGEQRANIRESIPAIDYLNRENTSLLYTYDVKDNGELDTTTIRSASKEEKTALDLILNEDPFLINRAIVGELPAEHFYNSIGNATTPSIQTSPWMGNSNVEYLYRGIYGDTLKVSGKTFAASTTKISMYAFETPSPDDSDTTGYSTGSAYIKFTSNSKNVDDDVISKLEKQDVRVLYTTNTDGGTFAYVDSTLTGTCENSAGITLDKKDFYTVDDSKFFKSLKDEKDESYEYQIELTSEDICTLLPKTILGGLATLVVFKKDSSAQSTENVKSLTWGPYKLATTNDEGTKKFQDPVKECISSQTKVTKGTIYHLASYPDEAYGSDATSTIRNSTNVPESVPKNLLADTDIIFIGPDGDGSNENNWKILGSAYKAFYIPVTSYNTTSSFEEIKVNDKLPGYLERTGVYNILQSLADIEKIYLADASGLLSGFYEEPYRRDGVLVEDETEVPSTTNTVTKWKFVNDVDTAKARGVSIDVGSKYFKGHLLGRGYFDDEPLRLTAGDYAREDNNIYYIHTDESGKKHLIRRNGNFEYKGKVLLTYDILSNATSSLFNKVQIKNFNTFPIRSLDDVVTRADYDGRTYSGSEAKNLLSDDDYNKMVKSGNYKYESILNYPEKLNALNEDDNGKNIADSEQILKYLTDLIGSINTEDKNSYSLYLDLTDEDGPCVSSRTSYQTTVTKVRVPNFKKDNCGHIKQDGYKDQEIPSTLVNTVPTGGSLGDIYTQLNKTFAVSYEVRLKSITSKDIDDANAGKISLSDIKEQEGNAFNFNIKMITPMEVFSTKNHYITSKFVDVYNGSKSFRSESKLATSERIIPTGTILVYPEYSKYLPTTMFLLSKTDLGLEVEDNGNKETEKESPRRSMVSFVAKRTNSQPNSVVSFKVTSVREFKPSKIRKVTLKTGDNKYETVNYDYGLYPIYKVNAVQKVTGFETIRVSLNSTTVTNSQGISFNFRDIINGVYSVAAGNERIVYNYATVGASSDTNSALRTVKSVKAVNRLNALMTAMSSEEEAEESVSTTSSSSDIEIRTNNLTSRETSATKNASGVESVEKDVAATKNQANPGYGIADASNTNFVRGYSYNKKSNVTITPVSNTNTSDEEGTVSMGGSSNIPEATQSGFNTYHMNTEAIQRCWYYLSQDAGKRRVPYNWVYVDVPKYSTTSYEYVPSVSDAYDCYIYVLEPMTLELDSITLYDQKNNKISFSDISNVEIIPMSYPSSFFAVSTLKDSTDQTVYQLKNRKDVVSLKDRLIVPGLPEFTSKEDLLTKYTRGIPMEPIANMIYSKDSSTNQVISSILGNAIYSVLKSWKLSGLSETAGTVNSLLLEDFPEMVKGLVEAKPVLRKLSNAGFTINLGESQYTITPNDINTIISRITDEDVVYKREYTVTRDTSEDNPKWLDDIPDYTGDDYQKAFIAEAKTRLKGIEVNYTKSKTGISRPSLKRIAVEVEKAFSTSNSLDENLCKTLDSFFGNDTKAFLTLGASEETDVSDSSSLNLIASENTLALGNKINEEFESVILSMALDVANKKNAETLNSKVCPIFKEYLNGKPSSWSSSVDAIESTVKTVGGGFKLLGYSSSNAPYRKLLESIKNNYRSYYKYSTQPYYWRRMSFDNWVRTYALDINESDIDNYWDYRVKSSIYWLFSWLFSYRSSYNLRNRILTDLRNLVYQQITSEIRAIYSSGSVNMPSMSQLADYVGEIQSGETHFNSTFGILSDKPVTEDNDPGVVGGKFCVTEIIPYYNVSLNSFIAPTKFSDIETTTGYKPKTPYLNKKNEDGTTSDGYSDTLDEFANLARQTFVMYSEPKSDAKVIVLKGIANYVKTALEGTGSDRYYVKYVKGDSKVSGRTNSLYYKRYLALNNRMNTAEGTLSALLTVYRNQSALNSSDEYAQNVSESYADKLAVIPVSRFSELTWMAPTKATGTSIAIPGKFYYKRELEALRNQIGDQCVLTCNKCNVQNSCPFYNPEEIIKLYCTPAETIDLYFKDNELDLIAYTEEEETDEDGNIVKKNYPDVWETSTDGESKSSIDVDKLKNIHTYYNDILSKVEGDTSKSQQFTGRDIQQVREELEKNVGTCEFDPVVDGENLGYLVGARYGTVRRNNMMVLANNDDSFTEFGKTTSNPLPTYQYLYDAVYIKDEETYFNYKTSSQKYDVSFETGPAHNKKHYEGKTRIKIPTSLKILESASPNDLVYLISDDKYDDKGNSITPIIYLGRVKNLQWTINMVEEPTRSIQNEYDSNVYASDIAQWCMNYYKGTCVEDPIGDIGNDPGNPSKPIEEDQDQYWMEEIKKKVTDSDGTESWITLEGRPRENTGYSEPLMDPEALNEAKVACGKPVVANYINFIRKFSIRIYNGDYAGQYDEAGNYLDDNVWTIPWVKGITSKERKSLVDGKYITWDTQRAALQFMKTNLRLVVVKNG